MWTPFLDISQVYIVIKFDAIPQAHPETLLHLIRSLCKLYSGCGCDPRIDIQIHDDQDPKTLTLCSVMCLNIRGFKQLQTSREEIK